MRGLNTGIFFHFKFPVLESKRVCLSVTKEGIYLNDNVCKKNTSLRLQYYIVPHNII